MLSSKHVAFRWQILICLVYSHNYSSRVTDLIVVYYFMSKKSNPLVYIYFLYYYLHSTKFMDLKITVIKPNIFSCRQTIYENIILHIVIKLQSIYIALVFMIILHFVDGSKSSSNVKILSTRKNIDKII